MTVGADWVAVSVRARGMAQQRIGAGAALRIAASESLDAARAMLTTTIYGPRVATASTLAQSQHQVSATLLWQLRVLAGWVPAGGGALARTLAAAFERANITGLAQRLTSSAPPELSFDLGTLGTAPAKLLTATTMTELENNLRHSAWGDPGHPTDVGALVDTLTISWLRRLASTAPAARGWAQYVCALVCGRTILVDQREPGERLAHLARPFIGTQWSTATDLTAFAAALPRSTRSILDGVSEPRELWRAEARFGTIVESDSLHLLRASLPGPDTMLGAISVLAVDAWRLRAALASAAMPKTTTNEEVTHAMA